MRCPQVFFLALKSFVDLELTVKLDVQLILYMLYQSICTSIFVVPEEILLSLRVD